MSKTLSQKFAITDGHDFKLSQIDASDDCDLGEKEKAKLETAEHAAAIDGLQDRLFAEGKRSLLVVLQGIDCSGKDGVVRGVFNTCGPIGVHVTPFKVPSEEERSHDYLWRVHKAAPPAGLIGIFNRSHYEEVLVVKVKKFKPSQMIEQHYEQINSFEKMLSDNGTQILKFMLHISKDEQAERLQDRVDDETKRWKFNPGDLEDRKLWDDYMAAYETMVQRCSTKHAPWHVIPANRKWVRNLLIAKITREALEEMNPQYPQPRDWDPKTIKIV